jgi:hypothetical protein
MKHTFRNKPIYIDNKDVNWFHMKERV